MKTTLFKKAGLLIAAFMLVASLVSNASVGATVDYSGGLLDGKKLFNSGGPTNGVLTDTEMTDNNESTSFLIAKYTQGPSGTFDHVNYDFTTPQTLKAYRLKTDRSNGIVIELYDNAGIKIKRFDISTTDGSLVEFPEIVTGVSKVSLAHSDTTQPLKVYEFNVYDQIPTPQPEPEPEPEPEQPSSNRAILVVTMNTGLEKEFDLSMQEVNSFIDWYETKQAGSGKASYAIDKHDNNRGPFKSRKDYVLFDRILTFEVSEY
ncbi:hypothetical protein [Paenibacillus xylanexedens]|uniref:hypothetical protein n=1 Tax=Paenibacillus xylanexedens TaxID=528191 RepID=UPI0021B509A6|nr:hypothetical protein [Paenibacillus xylanexedens]